MSAFDYALTEQEIKELTGYCRPFFQMRILKELGIPTKRRADNSLIVMRMHCMHPIAQKAANDTPQLRSSKK